MANQLKPGDVVWLKSGGPAMTVSSRYSEQIVMCKWFTETNRLKTESIADIALTKVCPNHNTLIDVTTFPGTNKPTEEHDWKWTTRSKQHWSYVCVRCRQSILTRPNEAIPPSRCLGNPGNK